MSITVYLNWTYSSYFTLFENVVIRWTQGNLNFLYKGIFSLIYLFDLEVVQKINQNTKLYVYLATLKNTRFSMWSQTLDPTVFI